MMSPSPAAQGLSLTWDQAWAQADALEQAGQAAPAAALFRQLLAAAGDHTALRGRVVDRLAQVLIAQLDLAGARALLLDQLKRQPNQPSLTLALARIDLLQGDLKRGFRNYEARLDDPATALYLNLPAVPQPRWKGQPLAGRRLLIHAEQGLGDTLQFCRFIRQLPPRTTVLLSGPPTLAPLIATLGFDGYYCERDSQLFPITAHRFDYWAPLLSLPRWLGTTLRTVPAPVPYLRADPARQAAWGQRLATLLPGAGPRVGLVWAGNPQHVNDRNRSMPLAALAPLAGLPGLQLVSLQLGPRAGDLATQDWAAGVVNLAPEIKDFADTAAIVANLDLTVAVDTAVIHLVGALGRPGRLLLPFAPDWRWLLDRDDSPWYPSLRLFRQPRPGDWASVVQRLVADLAAMAGR